jgi:hypothetical protein
MWFLSRTAGDDAGAGMGRSAVRMAQGGESMIVGADRKPAGRSSVRTGCFWSGANDDARLKAFALRDALALRDTFALRCRLRTCGRNRDTRPRFSTTRLYGKVTFHVPRETNGRAGHAAPLVTAASTDDRVFPAVALSVNAFLRKYVLVVPASVI